MGLDLLGELQQPFVALHPELFRITGSINAAILLRYLIYRSGDSGAWFDLSRAEIAKATCLTREQQFTAQAALLTNEFIETSTRNRSVAQFRVSRKKIASSIKNTKYVPIKGGCRKHTPAPEFGPEIPTLNGVGMGNSHTPKSNDDGLEGYGKFPQEVWEIPTGGMGNSHRGYGKFPHSYKKVEDVINTNVDPSESAKESQEGGVGEIPPPPTEIDGKNQIQPSSVNPPQSEGGTPPQSTGTLFDLPTPGTAQKTTKKKSEYTPEFQAWYESYPRHDAKADAQKAFTGAMAKLLKLMAPDQALDKLIQAAKGYALKMAGKEEQYIALPASWLRGERWEDKGLKAVPLGEKYKAAANGG